MNEFSWLYGASQVEQCIVCGLPVRPGYMADHFQYWCNVRTEVGRVYDSFAAPAVSDGHFR